MCSTTSHSFQLQTLLIHLQIFKASWRVIIQACVACLFCDCDFTASSYFHVFEMPSRHQDHQRCSMTSLARGINVFSSTTRRCQMSSLARGINVLLSTPSRWSASASLFSRVRDFGVIQNAKLRATKRFIEFLFSESPPRTSGRQKREHVIL